MIEGIIMLLDLGFVRDETLGSVLCRNGSFMLTAIHDGME